MHDVHSDVLNLEIIIKTLQRGKINKTGDGLNQSLHTMQVKLEHLRALTTEYCLLARNLLQGGGDIQTERLELKKDVITPILDEIQDALNNKEIRISCRQNFTTPDDDCVIGNRVMLKFVFRTLFGNAIKHCNDRSVISYGITSNDRRLKIQVANEGEVVPSHMRDSIFGEFVQAQTAASTCQTNGMGLGLALARDILRQHGGDIWYEAMANGSKFICTLTPCTAQSAG
jgi:signal transduction histidine kinase